jgi:AcrR family transcriptional regulator
LARPRQISDEALLEATRACVMEHGAAVSTTLIAEAVGVSQATLFKRFGTKEELLIAALAPDPAMVIPWMDLLEQGPEPGDFKPQLTRIVRAMVAFFEGMFPCMAALKAAGLMQHAIEHMRSMGRDAPPIRGRVAVEGWLSRALAAEQLAPCDPQAVSVALTSAAMGLAYRRHMFEDLSGELSGERYADQIVEMIWAGLAPAEGPETEGAQ